jgi:hypothetical protein
MYPSQVGQQLGIVGRALQHEVNLLCNLKWEEQRARINSNLENLDQQQVDNMQNFIDQYGSGKFNMAR